MNRLEIKTDISALVHNYNFLRKTVGEFYAVVKCDAYSHGISSCVSALKDAGCKHFAVVYADEAFLVRDIAPMSEILLLSRADKKEIPELCRKNIALSVFSEEYAEQFSELKKARVHLKIETSMNRTGLREEELSSKILSLPIEGIYTHFPRAENIHETCITAKSFECIAENVESRLGRRLTKHAASSFAAINFPETRFDMSRIGIALYGVGHPRLLPVKQVTTRVIHIHTARKGEYVGYGESYLCTKGTVIATVCGGYADGIPRSCKNALTAIIGDKAVKICGTPCMDRTMFDITPIVESGGLVSIGDEAEILGKAKSIDLSARECNITEYEVLLSLKRK